jgi:hypothetical protein
MPTTTNFDFYYPDGSDAIDIAEDEKKFVESLETDTFGLVIQTTSSAIPSGWYHGHLGGKRATPHVFFDVMYEMVALDHVVKTPGGYRAFPSGYARGTGVAMPRTGLYVVSSFTSTDGGGFIFGASPRSRWHHLVTLDGDVIMDARKPVVTSNNFAANGNKNAPKGGNPIGSANFNLANCVVFAEKGQTLKHEIGVFGAPGWKDYSHSSGGKWRAPVGDMYVQILQLKGLIRRS